MRRQLLSENDSSCVDNLKNKTGPGKNLTGEPKTTDPASVIPLVSRDLADNGCKDTTSISINEIFL
jgi:hypothetical protein